MAPSHQKNVRTALQERHRLGRHFGNGKGRCWRLRPNPAPACHIIHVITPESNRVFTVGMEWRGRREDRAVKKCQSLVTATKPCRPTPPRFSGSYLPLSKFG